MTKPSWRIALFCSINHRVPLPRNVIHAPLVLTVQLAEELSKRGHQVAIFAADGSKVQQAQVVPSGPAVTDLDIYKKVQKLNDRSKMLRFLTLHQQRVLADIFQQAKNFDVIHLHLSDIEHIIPFSKYSRVPTLVTLHDPISPFRKIIFKEALKIKNLYLISISQAQRLPFLKGNYLATIYHGLNLSHYPFEDSPRDYLLLLGRMVQEKGISTAIRVANTTKLPLKLAGRKYRRGPGKDYWQEQIQPYLGRRIKYIGMVQPDGLPKLYKNARALLFPIAWEEPFGLVMIEAMACGTPVIAFGRGSVPEIVKHKETGFIVRTEGEMVRAVKEIHKIDRSACRRHIEKHFSLKRMVENHEKVYARLIDRQK